MWTYPITTSTQGDLLTKLKFKNNLSKDLEVFVNIFSFSTFFINKRDELKIIQIIEMKIIKMKMLWFCKDGFILSSMEI